MKKLIVYLAAIAMAISANATAVDWASGVFTGPDGSSSKTGSKYSNVYSAVFSVYSDSAGANLINSATSTDVNKKGSIVSTIDLSEPASGVTKTYYAQLVITDIASGKVLESTMGAFSWTGGDLATPSLIVYGDSASGWTTTPAAPAGGWQTVPEPTSALLLLIGAGLVGLRRKRV